jgi:hypothetical protein
MDSLSTAYDGWHRNGRWAELDRLKPNFDDLDAQLYELENTVDIYEKLLKVVRRHKRDFYFEGVVERPVSR